MSWLHFGAVLSLNHKCCVCARRAVRLEAITRSITYFMLRKCKCVPHALLQSDCIYWRGRARLALTVLAGAVASTAVTDSTALFCRAISYCARAVYACVLFVRPAPPMLHTRLSVAGNTAPTAQSVLLLWCPASPYRAPYTHVGVQPLTTCTY